MTPWSSLPIYTVGPSTASFASLLGFQIVHGKECGNASNLAQAIIQSEPRDSLWLYLTGDKRRDTLPLEMEKAGIRLDELQAYETGPNPHFHQEFEILEQDSEEISWIVFFSPSGFDVALDTLKSRLDSKSILIASIGPTTTDYITSKGYAVSAQAVNPTPQSLHDAIASRL